MHACNMIARRHTGCIAYNEPGRCWRGSPGTVDNRCMLTVPGSTCQRGVRAGPRASQPLASSGVRPLYAALALLVALLVVGSPTRVDGAASPAPAASYRLDAAVD